MLYDVSQCYCVLIFKFHNTVEHFFYTVVHCDLFFLKITNTLTAMGAKNFRKARKETKFTNARIKNEEVWRIKNEEWIMKNELENIIKTETW